MKNFWVKTVFILAFLWWAYLFFTTQIVVVFDSEGYESLGRMIYQNGWHEYFRTGPNREPLFPAIVALSMYLADLLKVHYFYTLKMIGVLFLFITTLVSYRLMKMLSIRTSIICLALFYLAVSPVMTNSSMRLWSEFAAYPWVVLAVLWSIKSWKALKETPPGNRGLIQMAGCGAMVAVMFLLIMFVKAVAEGVILFYLWPFYWQMVSSWRARDFVKLKGVIVFCVVALGVFEGVTMSYKWLNYQSNGLYAFTNRADYALYGYTARRIEPLTLNRLGAAIVQTPGMGGCTELFKEEDCLFWTARHSDDILEQKRTELQKQGITNQQASSYYIVTSLKLFLSNPLQVLGLIFIEAHKVFFWESSIGFVAYPDWLEQIFYSPKFSPTLRIVLAVLSWTASVWAIVQLNRRRSKKTIQWEESRETLFWVTNFIFWFTAMYSIYFVEYRYVFPLVSLLMVLIAFMLDKLWGRIRHVNS